ncbi:MAG TPA: hypothetical protein VJI69_08390 [Bacteroidia bacterium]|nr:hypothetical protein [Bacteroidia bacterium]
MKAIIGYVVLALAGLFLIIKELRLDEKTWLLWSGMVMLLPLVLKIVAKFLKK